MFELLWILDLLFLFLDFLLEGVGCGWVFGGWVGNAKAPHKKDWISGFHIWPHHTHHTQMSIPNTWTCAEPFMEPAFGFHAKGMAWPLQVGAEEHNTLPCCRHPSLQYLSDASWLLS